MIFNHFWLEGCGYPQLLTIVADEPRGLVPNMAVLREFLERNTARSMGVDFGILRDVTRPPPPTPTGAFYYSDWLAQQENADDT